MNGISISHWGVITFPDNEWAKNIIFLPTGLQPFDENEESVLVSGDEWNTYKFALLGD